MHLLCHDLFKEATNAIEPLDAYKALCPQYMLAHIGVTSTHTSMHKCALVQTHVRAYTHTYTHMHARTHACTHTRWPLVFDCHWPQARSVRFKAAHAQSAGRADGGAWVSLVDFTGMSPAGAAASMQALQHQQQQQLWQQQSLLLRPGGMPVRGGMGMQRAQQLQHLGGMQVHGQMLGMPEDVQGWQGHSQRPGIETGRGGPGMNVWLQQGAQQHELRAHQQAYPSAALLTPAASQVWQPCGGVMPYTGSENHGARISLQMGAGVDMPSGMPRQGGEGSTTMHGNALPGVGLTMLPTQQGLQRWGATMHWQNTQQQQQQQQISRSTHQRPQHTGSSQTPQPPIVQQQQAVSSTPMPAWRQQQLLLQEKQQLLLLQQSQQQG